MNYTVFYRQRGGDALTGMIHSHPNDFEILHITRGEGSFIFSEREYSFRAGEVFCFDGSLPHYVQPRERTVYERSKLILPRDALFSLCALPPLSYRAGDEQIDALFKRIADTEGRELHALSLIFELLELCTREPSAPTAAGKRTIDAILQYIGDNLGGELSTDAIAKSCHLSKFHMCRVFKEHTGTTLGAYIRTQRIRRARELLDGTDRPICEIALTVGYGDVSHFIKVFREQNGTTPSRCRKGSKRA